jgi:2-dehydropantoate 2-reductase
LAAHLAKAGRSVLAVRTRRQDLPRRTVGITVHNGSNRIEVAVPSIGLSNVPAFDGTIVVAAKSYANADIAAALKKKAATGPIVIAQNGLGVEQPFLDAGFTSIYRCVLYATGQARSECEFSLKPVTASPIGTIVGEEGELARCVENLSTEEFSFRAEPDIQREIWKKAIINAAFNSICPLLEVDNGIFARDAEVANIARELVRECVAVTERLDVGLSESELTEQILRISRGSDGQLISTLQDIRNGRPTEIEFLNLEIARIAASLRLDVPRVELLGRLTMAKSLLMRKEIRP